jgi:hypothetical protein
LQIVRLPLVPARNDPWMVVRHSLLVIGNYVKPRHCPSTVASRLT